MKSIVTYEHCNEIFYIIGTAATLLTMPLDVMKTRMMNAPPGTYNSLMDCFKDILKVGPSGFFKGFMPAFIRLGKKDDLEIF